MDINTVQRIYNCQKITRRENIVTDIYESVSDITQTKFYSGSVPENGLTLTMYTDDVEPGMNGGNEIWPTYAFLNELDMKLRYKYPIYFSFFYQ